MGLLECLLPRMITKGISICAWASWQWLLEAQEQMMVSSVFGILATSNLPQNRPQSSDFLLETGILVCFFPHICLCHLTLGQLQLFTIDEANTKRAINEARNKKRSTWFHKTKERGPRKWRVGGNLVYWEHERCKHAYECWRTLTPEINYSMNFPNTGVEIMLLQSPLFFQCQNSVSHLFENPKYSDYEIEHESSITVFPAECHTKIC